MLVILGLPPFIVWTLNVTALNRHCFTYAGKNFCIVTIVCLCVWLYCHVLSGDVNCRLIIPHINSDFKMNTFIFTFNITIQKTGKELFSLLNTD